MNKPFDSADWTSKSLNDTWNIIREIAVQEFKLDFYEPYFEVCTFEEMLKIYTTSFPIMFDHWSFGKDYESVYRQYQNNRMSIAYEVIFNTDPALCYLLETNSSVMQGLVMAHAAVGHSAFFKMNSFIRENTNARLIIPFLKNFRTYVKECESKYGNEAVEQVLDVCKTFALYAVDKSEKLILTSKQRREKKEQRIREQEKDFDILVENVGSNKTNITQDPTLLRQAEENVLKFIAEYSPNLKDWEREIVRKYCKVEQYFYPQRLTKMMNEGFATFWHYQIMNRLYDGGHINEGQYFEFVHSHTGVTCQHDHDSKYYHGINVYKLGSEMFNDIKRICEKPTEEDKQFSPGLIGKNWIEEVNSAAINYRDSSFVAQFLSPKLVRDFKFLTIRNDSEQDFYEVTAVHDDVDFKEIRKHLENHYNLYNHIPSLSIEGASLKGNRTLYLSLRQINREYTEENGLLNSIKLLKRLWPHTIRLKYYHDDGLSTTDL